MFLWKCTVTVTCILLSRGILQAFSKCEGKVKIGNCPSCKPLNFTSVQNIIDLHIIFFFFYAVLVSEPWPMPILYVPQDAHVMMNCTADGNSPPFWSINLANDSSTLPHQFGTRQEQLNSYGFYEVPKIEISGMPLILRLLINETAKNNGTVIFCSRDKMELSTTLSIFGKISHHSHIDIYIIITSYRT